MPGTTGCSSREWEAPRGAGPGAGARSPARFARSRRAGPPPQPGCLRWAQEQGAWLWWAALQPPFPVAPAPATKVEWEAAERQTPAALAESLALDASTILHVRGATRGRFSTQRSLRTLRQSHMGSRHAHTHLNSPAAPRQVILEPSLPIQWFHHTLGLGVLPWFLSVWHLRSEERGSEK